MKGFIHAVIVFIVIGSIVYAMDRRSYGDYDSCKPVCTVTVGRVVDGDTFKTTNGLTIRIAGYNAPELDTVAGIRARYCLKDLIDGKDIRIVMTGQDRYGRQLARVLSHRISC